MNDQKIYTVTTRALVVRNWLASSMNDQSTQVNLMTTSRCWTDFPWDLKKTAEAAVVHFTILPGLASLART